MSWGLHVSGPAVPTVQGAGSPSSMVLSVPGVRVRTSTARSREKSMASTFRETSRRTKCASELAARHLPVNGRDVAASAADAEPRLQPRRTTSPAHWYAPLQSHSLHELREPGVVSHGVEHRVHLEVGQPPAPVLVRALEPLERLVDIAEP